MLYSAEWGIIMTVWIDRKYVNLVSSKLDRFAWKKGDLANFRCPVCGDSKTNKSKTRGYIFPRKGSLMFKCHNCNVGLSIPSFLKLLDPSLYREYIAENYRETNNKQSTPYEDAIKVVTKKVVRVPINKVDLTSIAELPEAHYARAYIKARKIPKEFYSRLYFTQDFRAFIDATFLDHGKALIANESRIVIPFWDKENNLIAVQGRAMKSDAKIRYITIKADEDAPKVYGLDRHDRDKLSYVLEGPFDSMFLPNALAVAGASLTDVMRFVDIENAYFVYDNEPRNKDVVHQMARALDHGLSVCIWPESLLPKDINDFILAGFSVSEVQSIIHNNTYKGLEAKFRLSQWKKY